MKICHLTALTNGGGAAIACRRLNDIMNRLGVDSNIISPSDLSGLRPKASFFDKICFSLKRWLYYRKHKLEINQYATKGCWNTAYSLNRLDTNKKIHNADIVYLHWIGNNLVSIEELGKLLASRKNIVWFLHDMWAITGGCHYSMDCDRYQMLCGNCPLLLNSNVSDLSNSIIRRKILKLKGHSNLTIVSPSNWLAKCCRKSSVFSENRIEVIPNVIDTDLFHPISKKDARKVLELPIDKRLVLFGCNLGTTNVYKGWKYLEEALSFLDSSKCELVVFGQKTDTDLVKKLSFKIHFLGRLNDEFPSLVLAYSAADVFVSPSIAENFSLTLCEASACETPPVCFNIGGNSDIVLHKNSGYLAKYKDSNDLARGICWVLDNTEALSLGKNAREHITKLCSVPVVIKKHFSLIDSILNN